MNQCRNYLENQWNSSIYPLNLSRSNQKKKEIKRYTMYQKNHDIRIEIKEWNGPDVKEV